MLSRNEEGKLYIQKNILLGDKLLSKLEISCALLILYNRKIHEKVIYRVSC